MTKLLMAGFSVFIGIHNEGVLQEAGNELLVFIDISNSRPIALGLVGELDGPAAIPRLRQIQGDMRKPRYLEQAFTKAPTENDAVIHIAGPKAVEESVEKRLHY